MLASSQNSISLAPDYTFFFQLAIFFAVLLILNNLVFRPMMRLYAMRRKYTLEAEESAKESAKKALELELETKRKIAEVLRETMLSRENLLADAREKAEKITGQAKAQSKEISVQARNAALVSKEKAREDMPNSAKKLADEIKLKALS